MDPCTAECYGFQTPREVITMSLLARCATSTNPLETFFELVVDVPYRQIVEEIERATCRV